MKVKIEGVAPQLVENEDELRALDSGTMLMYPESFEKELYSEVLILIKSPDNGSLILFNPRSDGCSRSYLKQEYTSLMVCPRGMKITLEQN